MVAPSTASQHLAASGSNLAALKASARQDPKGAIREVAKQFEALFMQELMKSMRASTMSSGLMDNQASDMATGMLDQQYATQMAGVPGGLADAIARQLEGGSGASSTMPQGWRNLPGGTRWQPVESAGAASGPGARVASPAATAGTPSPAATAGSGSSGGLGAASQFIERHRASAQAVAAESGIPADFMLAQAAHETGWGRRDIRASDGSASNNLFGIKAGPGWKGPVAVTTTTEVVDGRPQKVQAAFRAYATPEESFRDYARLISTSPRYAAVMQVTNDAQAFARGLQRAGYATDPDYATKLGRVIQTTRRLVDQADAGAASARLGLPGSAA